MKTINQIKRWRGIFLFVFQKESSVNKQYSLFRKAPAKKGITLKCWLCSLCFMLPSLSAIAQNDSTNIKEIQGNRLYIGANFNYFAGYPEYNVPRGFTLGYLPFRNFLLGVGAESSHYLSVNLSSDIYLFSRYYFPLVKNTFLFPEISYHRSSLSKYTFYDYSQAYRGGIGITYLAGKNLGIESYLAFQYIKREDRKNIINTEREMFFRMSAAFYIDFKKKQKKTIYDKSYPQLQRNSFMIGGNLASSYSKYDKRFSFTESNKLIFTGSFIAGYFILPKILIGGTGSYAHYRDYIPTTEQRYSWNIGILGRYYLPYKKIAFIGQLDGEKGKYYGISNVSTPTYYFNSPFYYIGEGIGIAWFAKPYMSFEYMLLNKQILYKDEISFINLFSTFGISFYLYRNENNHSNNNLKN